MALVELPYRLRALAGLVPALESPDADFGRVENGVWLLWLPTTEDPMVRGCEFQRAESSIALDGSGQVVPDP